MAGGTDDRRASVEVQRAPLEDGPTTSITGEPRVCGPRHAQASTSEGLESTGEASTAVLGSRQAFLAGLQPGSLEAAGELQAPELLPSIPSLRSVEGTSTCESKAKDKDGQPDREQHEPLAASKARPGRRRQPPKEKGDSSSARRLRLEHTFNQGDESRLEQALSGLHQAAHTEHQLQDSLMQAADAVNRVRHQQAEDLDQLRDMMVGVFLDVPSIAAVTRTAGGLTHCLPFVVIPSFGNKVFEDSSSRAGAVWFSEGPLAGLRIPLTTIYRACSAYTGEPCNLLDPDDCPPSLKPLHRIMVTQNKGIIHVYLQIGKNRSSEEVRRLAARLRVMMDELMSIQTAILFSNLRLAGSLTPARPMLSPEEWHSMMAALQLSEEQVQQCRELRAHLRRRFATVQMAKQCSQDLLDDMVGGMTSTSLPLSTDSAMQLLDIAAARRKAGFDMQTLWTEATIRLAFDILSSEQNSMRMAVRALASTLKGRRASQNDYMYFHLYSFVDAEMSSWMDVLPSASGQSAQQSMGL